MASAPIVVGVDGLGRAFAALDWALAEARTRGCPVHLLHATRGDADEATMGRTLSAYRQRAASAAPDVEITVAVVQDRPVPALVAASDPAELRARFEADLADATARRLARVLPAHRAYNRAVVVAESADRRDRVGR